jgi:hypothetical protein
MPLGKKSSKPAKAESSSSEPKNIFAPFVSKVEPVLAKMKSGDKLDRKALQEEIGFKKMSESDFAISLGIYLRYRGGFESKKGKSGGTFKL